MLMNVTLGMEAVITLALTMMALSCVLVVQALLWQMMILAVMVNCVLSFANKHLLICFV